MEELNKVGCHVSLILGKKKRHGRELPTNVVFWGRMKEELHLGRVLDGGRVGSCCHVRSERYFLNGERTWEGIA